MCVTYRLRFSIPEETDVEEVPLVDTPYHPPEITPLYSVSARLQPLFQDADKKCVQMYIFTPQCDAL